MSAFEEGHDQKDSYKPEDLKHIAGQEGLVRAPVSDIGNWIEKKLGGGDAHLEKARQMAEIEKGFRDSTKLYQDYLAVPADKKEAWSQEKMQQRDMRGMLRDKSLQKTMPLLKEIAEKGITPEYFTKIGEILAETEGAFFDWKYKNFKYPEGSNGMKSLLPKLDKELEDEMKTPAFKEAMEKAKGKEMLSPKLSAEQNNAISQILLMKRKDNALQKEAEVFEMQGQPIEFSDRTVGRLAALGDAMQTISAIIAVTGALSEK